MKVVFVTPQIPIAYETGGIGTYIWHFSRLLRKVGDDVHIVFTHPPARPSKEYLPPFEALGITVTAVQEYGAPIHIPNGYSWQARIAELAAEAIPSDADVVYFADWEANGIHFVRSRRFSGDRLPAVVTVLHGNTKWNRQGMRTWPGGYEDIAQDFREAYVAEHSDFVAAPSRYMLEWAHQNNWKLPPAERVHALHYPFEPNPSLGAAAPTPSTRFERIAFYGRIDTRKGIDLFVESLIGLTEEPCMRDIKDVVLLGGPGQNNYGTPNDIAKLLCQELPDVQTEALTTLNTFEAQAYLAERASNTLVVIPSRSETLGFTVIEASLIPGLNIIASSAGGIPEVFGPSGTDQLFEPYLKPTMRKIKEWLLEGPRDASRLARYDWQAANARWLAFHQEVCAYSQTVRSELGNHSRVPVHVHAGAAHSESEPITGTTEPIARSSAITAGSVSLALISGVGSCESKAVDICIPYYNLGKYLPLALQALETQTVQDFNVYVVNDGSTKAESIAVFDQMRRKYQDRANWHFLSTENRGVCEARNRAAASGEAEYIIFVDADNIPAPNMVERFLQSIRTSGDDCLTCYMYMFKGEGHYRSASGLLHSAVFHYVPVGNCWVLGMLNNPFGDVNCIMRRSAFEAVGGFLTDYPNAINHEDRELLTRLALAGFSVDIIPEFLAFYRHREDSRLRTTDNYLNDGRVLRHYEERLRQVGLDELAPLVLGFHYGALAHSASATPPSNSLNYLVYRVSGYAIVKALAVKIRNQIAKRLGRPLIP